jgi:hypothetical protein
VIAATRHHTLFTQIVAGVCHSPEDWLPLLVPADDLVRSAPAGTTLHDPLAQHSRGRLMPRHRHRRRRFRCRRQRRPLPPPRQRHLLPPHARRAPANDSCTNAALQLFVAWLLCAASPQPNALSLSATDTAATSPSVVACAAGHGTWHLPPPRRQAPSPAQTTASVMDRARRHAYANTATSAPRFSSEETPCSLPKRAARAS